MDAVGGTWSSACWARAKTASAAGAAAVWNRPDREPGAAADSRAATPRPRAPPRRTPRGGGRSGTARARHLRLRVEERRAGGVAVGGDGRERALARRPRSDVDALATEQRPPRRLDGVGRVRAARRGPLARVLGPPQLVERVAGAGVAAAERREQRGVAVDPFPVRRHAHIVLAAASDCGHRVLRCRRRTAT